MRRRGPAESRNSQMLRSTIAMHLQQEFHFLQRNFENGGDLGRRFAPAVHPQGLRPLLQIEPGARRRRASAAPAACWRRSWTCASQRFRRFCCRHIDRRLVLRLALVLSRCGAPAAAFARATASRSSPRRLRSTRPHAIATAESLAGDHGGHRRLRRRSCRLAISWMRTP